MPPSTPSLPRLLSAKPEDDMARTCAETASLCDATVIGEAPQPPHRRSGAKISVTRGPSAGAELSLGPGETSIGRQGDNTLILPDVSVSRRHVLLRKVGLAYALVDQGSGNGTLVNGVRVQGEIVLQDGDVIVLGDSELTFFAGDEGTRSWRPTGGEIHALARRPAEIPESAGDTDPELTDPEWIDSEPIDSRAGRKFRTKRLAIVASSVAVLLLLLASLKVYQERSFQARQRENAERQMRAAEEALSREYEAGKKATSARSFKDAAEHFRKAAGIAADVGIGERDLQRRLELAEKEIGNQGILEAARGLAERGELASAMEKIKAIPEESLLSDQASEMIATVKKKIPDRLAAGRSALSSKRYDSARQAVADVLAADPGNSDALAFDKEIEKAGQPAPVGTSAPASRPADPTAKGVEAFSAGRLDEAIALLAWCNESKCRALKDKMSAFRDAYESLEAEGNAEKAAALLRSLPGGSSSPYKLKLAALGAASLVKEGLEAMTAETYPRAFVTFRQVLALDPSNDIAKQNLGIIHQKAKQLSEQAYIDMQLDPDKARPELEQILQMTEARDELNQKAKSRLKRLSGGLD